MNLKQRVQRERKRQAGAYLAPDWLTPDGWKPSGANKLTVERSGDHFVVIRKGKIIGAFHVELEDRMLQSMARRRANRMEGSINVHRGHKGDFIFRKVEDCRRCDGTGQYKEKGVCYTCNGKGELSSKIVNIVSPADLLKDDTALPKFKVNDSGPDYRQVACAIRRHINYAAWQKTKPTSKGKWRQEWEERQQRLYQYRRHLHLMWMYTLWLARAEPEEVIAA